MRFIEYDHVSYNVRFWAARSEREFIRGNAMHYPGLNEADRIEALKAAYQKITEASKNQKAGEQ